ncbi:uncharacterized protein N7459_007779 [Penicillium hispanicum]|uniref:uncharacterized protein n=1 Tax=Penicillium hispanicum TaxID=1080232 RepID=UPI0025403F42|nr:uncharacterized protein N7459_007779 [Penicillium hispanicum]KAJ5573352.1 hypothetical protein N7459_007779 [Penicillium hispanicum]
MNTQQEEANDVSIAWALEDCADDVEVVQTWPGEGSNSSQKAPTLLSYQRNRVKWGYQVDDLTDAIRGVKLLLDENQKFRYAPAAESEEKIRKLGKTPVQVTAEYLKMLVTHAKDILCRRFGSALQTMDIHYTLTVPAIWSDKAKDATLQAARLANVPSSCLFLLSEPEAAAACAIRTIQPNSMAEGDCFIVCDAGGGTVDLITYRITQNEPLRLEEVTEGTGAVCGSVILDERFEDFLVRIIGKNRYNSLPAASKLIAMRHWQNYIKPSYQGRVHSDGFADIGYFAPLPGLPDLPEFHLTGGLLYMEHQQIEEIFEPIMAHIENLIDQQRLKAKEAGLSTKAVILVGGLGASEYLFKGLQREFQGIDIMQPTNAWSAVVSLDAEETRGAVYHGQDGNRVQNRKSRCHYGVATRTKYNPKLHGQDQKLTWCRFEEQWMVDGQMEWYIQKDRPIKISFYRTFGLNESLRMTDTLEFCVQEQAPKTHTSSKFLSQD